MTQLATWRAMCGGEPGVFVIERKRTRELEAKAANATRLGRFIGSPRGACSAFADSNLPAIASLTEAGRATSIMGRLRPVATGSSRPIAVV